tara:strand:- start:39 stop:395 length:357 start_codon:yes stop_codon:yes gene_type:complete
MTLPSESKDASILNDSLQLMARVCDALELARDLREEATVGELENVLKNLCVRRGFTAEEKKVWDVLFELCPRLEEPFYPERSAREVSFHLAKRGTLIARSRVRRILAKWGLDVRGKQR